MASSVAAPLERRLGQIAGVNEMTSISTLGGTSVTLQFDLNRNVDGAARDVQAAINAAANDLPLDLPGPPTYRKVNPADAPIMIMAMTSDTLPLTKVFEYGNDIVAQKLSQIEGVSQAFVGGGAKSAVRVQINPSALASTGLSLEDVRSMLGQINVDLPKGSVDGEPGGLCHFEQRPTHERGRLSIDLLLTQPNGVSDSIDRAGECGGKHREPDASRLERHEPGGAGDCFQTARRERDRNRGPHQGTTAADPDLAAARDQDSCRSATARSPFALR